ncbi:MAG: hypothetical protein IKJ59_05325 [Clostridia bacterium]|nr:hypothetical protein [Clostridia bacterium]
MLVDKDDEQKCCMSRRTTKAYCLYGEEVQRRQAVFMPLDLSTVVLGIGIRFSWGSNIYTLELILTVMTQSFLGHL